MINKICANKTCKKRFSVRTKKEDKRGPNVHRKYCYDCDGVKIWESLNVDRATFLRKRWARLNPEKAKARYKRHRLKKMYGLTPRELKRLKKKQKNRCAICGQKFNGRWNSPNIDHKHGKEGTHRGLLCVTCNLLIGYCKENIKILRKAASYLRFWEGKQ